MVFVQQHHLMDSVFRKSYSAAEVQVKWDNLVECTDCQSGVGSHINCDFSTTATLDS